MTEQNSKQICLISSEEYGQAFDNGGFQKTVAVVRKLGANATEAEEFAQEAWGVQGWTKRHQLKDPRRVVEWATSIAVNLMRDEMAKDRRLAAVLSDARQPGLVPEVNVEATDVARALKCCPKRQRDLLESIYLLGKEPGQLAADLGISPDAVHHRLFRARHAARRAMGSSLASDDRMVVPQTRRTMLL